MIRAVVDLSLGLKPHVVMKTPESKYISNEFIYCKPGIFDQLQGFDELKKSGVISDYALFKWRGAVFETIENSGDRVASFTIQANTQAELIDKHNKALSIVRVLDSNGDDIMRHDLLTDLQFPN